MKWRDWGRGSGNANWRILCAKLRESHATIQELTSKIQQLQERVNCVNDSRNFQDFESICSGKLSYSRSGSASSYSKSTFKAKLRQTLATWHMESVWDTGKTFLSIHVLYSSHHKYFIKEFFTLRIKVPVESQYRRSTGRLVAKGEEQTGNTIPIPIFARRPPTMSSLPSAMVDQQRLHISELHFDKFPTLSTFSSWKIRFKTQVCSCSGFPSEAMLWIKQVEMVFSVDEFKSSRSASGKHFPNFDMLDARIASALNKIIQNSHFKKKVSREEQKAQKEDWFPRGRQIASTIYDYFRVTGAPDKVLDYADLFSVNLHNDNIQDFDSRWDKVLLSMTKIPSDDVLGSLYMLRTRDSQQLKTLLELYDTWRFIRKYRCPIVKNGRQWWKGVQIRNFD